MFQLSDAGSTRSFSSSRNYGGSISNLAGGGTSGFQSSPWKSSSYSAGLNKDQSYLSTGRDRGRSGYMSDYGGSTFSTRSERFRSTREKSPVRSFRPSRTDRDTTFRSSSATLTPFENRRSRTSDSTPFTPKLNRSRSYEPTYQRQSVSHSVSSLAAKFERREEPRRSTIASDRFSKRYTREEPKESSVSSDRFSRKYSRDNKEPSISSDRFSRKYTRQEPKESSISTDRFSKRYSRDEPKERSSDRYSSKYSERPSFTGSRFTSDRQSLTSFASSSRRDRDVPSYSRQASRESRAAQEDIPLTAKAIRERRHEREREREREREKQARPPQDIIERRSMRAQKAYKESGESLGARERRISREILQKSRQKDTSSTILEQKDSREEESINEKPLSARERRLAREKQVIPVIDVRSKERVEPVSDEYVSSSRERRLAKEEQAIPVIDVRSTETLEPSKDLSRHSSHESLSQRNKRDTSEKGSRYFGASRQKVPRTYEKDSSDSVSEQELLDADVRFLTSQGTNTGDIDSEPVWYNRRAKKKSISRTKTKRYPKCEYKRARDRPLLIDCACQVNQEELRHFRRMQMYGSKSSLYFLIVRHHCLHPHSRKKARLPAYYPNMKRLKMIISRQKKGMHRKYLLHIPRYL